MIEFALHILSDLPVFGVLLFVCFITFIENIFPPSPSDLILVFCGTLVGFSTTGFFPMVISATAGSVLGFALMYWIGHKFGVSMVEAGKIKFLPLETVHKAEAWFKRYGFGIIIANRFLSGTRAIISLFAGMSELPFTKTMILSGVSAAVWNTLLLGAGAAVGKNWRALEPYLALYGKIALGVVALIALYFIGKKVLNTRKPPTQAE